MVKRAVVSEKTAVSMPVSSPRPRVMPSSSALTVLKHLVGVRHVACGCHVTILFSSEKRWA